MMKITIDVDIENNEGTESPWWIILDPKQNFNTNERGVHAIASMITGPFFSRAKAQLFLERTRYNFSQHAKVYCHSGYYSRDYKEAIRNANNPPVEVK